MKSVPKSEVDNSLPLVMDIGIEEFRDIYPTWLQWRATERRFLPTELRGQPQSLLDGLLYIDAIFEKLVAQMVEQEAEKK